MNPSPRPGLRVDRGEHDLDTLLDLDTEEEARS